MNEETPRPLHSICWLAREGSAIHPVGRPADADVREPADLGEGEWELHWFGNPALAAGFVLGVEAADRNSVSAFRGRDGAESAVLLHRADAQTPLADTLDAAVSLRLHANASDRRAELRWRSVRASLRSMYRSESQTVKPVRIGEVGEEGFDLRICYPFWNGHIHGGIPGGDNYLRVVDRGGMDFLELRLDRYGACVQAGDEYINALADAAAAGGWRLEGDMFSLEVDREGIAHTAARLSPVFDAMWKVEEEAIHHNRVVAVLADRNNRRIVNAIRKGGTLSHRSCELLHSDGRKERIPSGRIGDMVRTGMLLEDGDLCVAPEEGAQPDPPSSASYR